MSSFVVTGAARGIGLEFVNQLSSNSANTVFALVRSKKTAHRVIELNRSNVHILQADITNYQELTAAVQEVSSLTGGKLDVLINNAALIDRAPAPLSFDDYSKEEAQNIEDAFNRSFHVNVIGVVHTINAFMPLLQAGQTKKVITISSGVGDLDFTLSTEFFESVPYSVSKAALNLAIGKYATRYKSEGFIFLSISPGAVNTATEPPTEELREFFQDMIKKFRVVYPDFKGPITPEESVKAVLHVVDEATLKDTGAFISHKGNKEWI